MRPLNAPVLSAASNHVGLVPPDLARNEHHPRRGVVVTDLLEGGGNALLQLGLVPGGRDRYEVRAEVEERRCLCTGFLSEAGESRLA
jgi:hypothetical protein